MDSCPYIACMATTKKPTARQNMIAAWTAGERFACDGMLQEDARDQFSAEYPELSASNNLVEQMIAGFCSVAKAA